MAVLVGAELSWLTPTLHHYFILKPLKKIVSRLTDLIANAKAKDPQMGADLEREFRALSSRLSFGLNFERHSPEAVELPNRPVRRGDKVRVLPLRGSTAKGDQRLWLVKTINKKSKMRWSGETGESWVVTSQTHGKSSLLQTAAL